MRVSVRAQHLPQRVATGAFILNSGIGKLRADQEAAAQLHGFAAGAYPFVNKLKPTDFTRLLAVSEITLGAALLLPVVPAAVAGAGRPMFGSLTAGNCGSTFEWSSPIGRDAVPNRVALGVGGLEADPGDHICGVISGEEERNQILIPFLQVGLASGDKCICVIDGTPPAEIVTALGPEGDAATRTAGKQLEVIGASDMYLRSGRFSAGEVIASWKAAMSDAMYAGQFDVVRAVETWSRRDVLPDLSELLTLESEMNRYLPLYPQVVMCLYDMDQFGSGALVSLVMTHPRMLVGGMVIENPYYLTPDEVPAKVVRRDTGTVIPVTKEAEQWYSGVMTG